MSIKEIYLPGDDQIIPAPEQPDLKVVPDMDKQELSEDMSQQPVGTSEEEKHERLNQLWQKAKEVPAERYLFAAAVVGLTATWLYRRKATPKDLYVEPLPRTKDDAARVSVVERASGRAVSLPSSGAAARLAVKLSTNRKKSLFVMGGEEGFVYPLEGDQERVSIYRKEVTKNQERLSRAFSALGKKIHNQDPEA